MAQLAAAPSLLHIHLIQLLLQAFLEGVVLQPLIGLGNPQFHIALTRFLWIPVLA